MRWEKFFWGLGTLLPQPESRTSQWRTKKITFSAMEKFFANLKVELLNGELDGEDEGGGEGDGHSPVADLDGEVGELGLQDGPLLLLPILLAALRVLA